MMENMQYMNIPVWATTRRVLSRPIPTVPLSGIRGKVAELVMIRASEDERADSMLNFKRYRRQKKGDEEEERYTQRRKKRGSSEKQRQIRNTLVIIRVSGNGESDSRLNFQCYKRQKKIGGGKDRHKEER